MAKKGLLMAIIVGVIVGLVGGGMASEAFDVYQYSYEELTEIRELIDERLEEMNRQYALEHANRKISFETEEEVVYLGWEFRTLPTVEAIGDDAPAQTALVWSSSDPDIATVSAKGTVRAISRGDAVITASAKDNPYLSGSYAVHAAVPVEQVTVWGEMSELRLSGDPDEASTTLGFSIEPEDAYFQEVEWTSSNEAVATVDENGQVTGIAPGTAVITATVAENPLSGREPKTANYTMTVAQNATGLQLSETEIALAMGQKGSLTATIEPETTTDKQVIYRSDNPAVAIVDENGQITPVDTGECVILCETVDGSGLRASCRVVVSRKIEALTVTETEVSLALGSTHQIEAVILPENATKKELMWTSSNVFVARVAEGTIEAVGQGDCEITCTTQDGSDLSATIRVRVPTFSIGERTYAVTEKTGLTIPVKVNAEGVQLTIASVGEDFTAEMDEERQIRIIPINAGTGVISVANPAAPEDTVRIQISIENSAVYNQQSYPPIPYMELVRVPDLYEGAQVSLYGRILHIAEDEKGVRTFMIGTAGETYTDQVMSVVCDPAVIPTEEEVLAGGEMATVYGLFRMKHAYSEALQAETMVPTVEAEKMEVTEK